MKKIILVLGLMLGVCLSVYGVSQSDINELYRIMDKQHLEHPGLIWVEITGSSSYVSDMSYYIGQWIGFYSEHGYDVNNITPTAPNKFLFEITSPRLIEEYDYYYSEDTGTWFLEGEYGAEGPLPEGHENW